ncbi:MAG: hypothetical protein HWN67_17630, partial [Candidatus Helarchaeota archaeon]|nr:hypothetical protein [Candidatus Helarchaeota archaeon]
PGQYDVVNQVSGLYKIRELAETVAKVGKEKFGIDVKIQRVQNPRVEAEKHPFNVVSQKLPNTFGFKPKVSLEKEITRMFQLLTQEPIRKKIEEKAHLILPETWWSGEKKKVETLEVYKPGTKELKGYKPKLITEERDD